MQPAPVLLEDVVTPFPTILHDAQATLMDELPVCAQTSTVEATKERNKNNPSLDRSRAKLKDTRNNGKTKALIPAEDTVGS